MEKKHCQEHADHESGCIPCYQIERDGSLTGQALKNHQRREKAEGRLLRGLLRDARLLGKHISK